jgi:ferric-dicitrate binding protein FerR (iron transport regulator)
LENKVKISDLIENQLDGTISKEQEQFLNSFVEKVADESITEIDSLELDAIKRKIQLRLDREIHYRLIKKRQRYALSIAASLVTFLGIYYFSFYRSIEFKTNYLTFVTSKAIDSVKLSDGSVVYLKENSKLTYPASFENQKCRNVAISGEAFFKVTKNPKKPFVVKSKELVTKVLGTSFGIISRDLSNEVIVVTGKVGVSSKNQNRILYPNQKVVLEPQGNLIKSNTNSSFKFMWTEKYQIFEDETLENISQYLESRFDKKLIIESKELKNYKIKIRLENKSSLIEILEKIKFITSINYKIKNNEVILTKK